MGGCKYVCILDDNDTSLKIVARMFERIGWCVIRCRFFTQTIHCLLDNDIAMVMTDFMLSEKHTAVELVSHIRQFERESMDSKRTPVICFSAHNNVEKAFLAAGGDLFLPKPITLEQVVAVADRFGRS